MSNAEMGFVGLCASILGAIHTVKYFGLVDVSPDKAFAADIALGLFASGILWRRSQLNTRDEARDEISRESVRLAHCSFAELCERLMLEFMIYSNTGSHKAHMYIYGSIHHALRHHQSVRVAEIDRILTVYNTNPAKAIEELSVIINSM